MNAAYLHQIGFRVLTDGPLAQVRGYSKFHLCEQCKDRIMLEANTKDPIDGSDNG